MVALNFFLFSSHLTEKDIKYDFDQQAVTENMFAARNKQQMRQEKKTGPIPKNRFFWRGSKQTYANTS